MNEQSPQEKPKKNALLDELESIHSLLDEEELADIPVLNDVVNESEPQAEEKVLDFKAILGDPSPMNDGYQPLCEADSEQDNIATIAADTKDIPEQCEHTVEEDLLFPELDDDPMSDDIAEAEMSATLNVTRDEEQSDMFPTLDDYMGTACPLPQSEEPFEVEPLIQNIINEAVPAFEAQLRKRLENCAPEIIRQLAAQYTSQ